MGAEISMIDLSTLKKDPVKEADTNMLLKIAETFERADRLGKEEDSPEGSRYIMITDTLAIEIANKLREIVSRR